MIKKCKKYRQQRQTTRAFRLEIAVETRLERDHNMLIFNMLLFL